MLPTLHEAEDLLQKANGTGDGFWYNHSRTTARAAQTIGAAAGLHGESAYILGLLHDFGRQTGRHGLFHMVEGHRLLAELGWDEAARICLNHSFPLKEMAAEEELGEDTSAEDRACVVQALDAMEYDDYDRLIQLCDCISMPHGVVPIQVRLMNAVRRAPLTDMLQQNINAVFALKEHFDRLCNQNIYALFHDEMWQNTLALP